MRAIITDADSPGLDLAKYLIKKGWEVILVEKNPDVSRGLSETLDCTVINAEGTSPDILEKAGINEADAVIACTGHDQDNIIIGFIARDYKVPQIVITTHDLQFMNIARKLGFRNVVNPYYAASISIYHILEGIDTIDLSTMMRGDVRMISVIAGDEFEGRKLSEIELPKKSEFIGLYRGIDFHLLSEGPVVKSGDEILIVTLLRHVSSIYQLFSRNSA